MSHFVSNTKANSTRLIMKRIESPNAITVTFYCNTQCYQCMLTPLSFAYTKDGLGRKETHITIITPKHHFRGS